MTRFPKSRNQHPAKSFNESIKRTLAKSKAPTSDERRDGARRALSAKAVRDWVKGASQEAIAQQLVAAGCPLHAEHLPTNQGRPSPEMVSLVTPLIEGSLQLSHLL